MGCTFQACIFQTFTYFPGWTYSGRKEATRDDAVSVPAYNLFSLGARMTPGGEQGRVTLRLFADNILDKRYWKDTGAQTMEIPSSI